MLSGRWDVAAVGAGQTLIGVDMVAGEDSVDMLSLRVINEL